MKRHFLNVDSGGIIQSVISGDFVDTFEVLENHIEVFEDPRLFERVDMAKKEPIKKTTPVKSVDERLTELEARIFELENNT